MPSADVYIQLFGDMDRRAPGSDEISRRVARSCSAGPGSRVLALGSGPGRTARLLAREYGCSVVCVDSDARALDLVKERARGDGVDTRIVAKQAEIAALPFKDAEFDAVVAEGLEWAIPEAAAAIRRVLTSRGRLAVTAPCRVGRSAPQTVLEFWNGRLGRALELPAELLQHVERSGYEPLSCETLAEALWEEHYRLLESSLAKLSSTDGDAVAKELRREIDVFRKEGGRFSVTYALVVARRKEQGEKPPAARSSRA